MRVLVVEDDRRVASFIQKGLEQEGLAVDVLHDGGDADVQAHMIDYDCVVLDLLLPGRHALVKPLPLRNSLTLVYTGILAVLVTALAMSTHSMFVRQLDAAATTSLEEKARGLHGYLQFKDGMPVLEYDRTDAESAAFVDDATDYYQVYDGRTGRLLVQSPGLESLGLQYTSDEVAEFRDQPDPTTCRRIAAASV